jgi:hypothetical protein
MSALIWSPPSGTRHGGIAAIFCQRLDSVLVMPKSTSFGVAACDFKTGLRLPRPRL